MHTVRPALLLASTLVVVLALSGCGGAPRADVGSPGTDTQADPDEAAGGEVASGEDAQPAIPSFLLTRHREEADERHPTYALDLAYPRLEGVDADVADSIAGELAAWIDDQVVAYAAEDAEFAHDLDVELPPGELDIRAASGAHSASLLSVLLTQTTMHHGAAHPWTTLHAITFDLATGTPVTLPELFDAPPETVLQVVSDAVVPALVASLDPEGEGWATQTVADGAGPDLDALSRFVVEREGLVLHFDQYQVAPGAAGPQQVTLPWAALTSALAPSPRLDATLRELR